MFGSRRREFLQESYSILKGIFFIQNDMLSILESIFHNESVSYVNLDRLRDLAIRIDRLNPPSAKYRFIVKELGDLLLDTTSLLETLDNAEKYKKTGDMKSFNYFVVDYSNKDALLKAKINHLIAVFQELVDNGKF